MRPLKQLKVMLSALFTHEIGRRAPASFHVRYVRIYQVPGIYVHNLSSWRDVMSQQCRHTYLTTTATAVSYYECLYSKDETWLRKSTAVLRVDLNEGCF